MYAPAFDGRRTRRWIVLDTLSGKQVGLMDGFDSQADAQRFADQLNGPFDEPPSDDPQEKERWSQ